MLWSHKCTYPLLSNLLPRVLVSQSSHLFMKEYLVVFCLVVCFLIWFLYSLHWPGTHYSPRLMTILPFQPSQYWGYRIEPPHLDGSIFQIAEIGKNKSTAEPHMTGQSAVTHPGKEQYAAVNKKMLVLRNLQIIPLHKKNKCGGMHRLLHSYLHKETQR